MMKGFVFYCLLLGVLLSGAAGHAEPGDDNARALQGLSRVQVYFDVNVSEAKLLEWRMELIDRTMRQIHEAGLTADTVIGIRGGASVYATKDEHYVLEEEAEHKRKIQQWLTTFVSRGAMVELCSIAALQKGIDLADVLPEVQVVKNGYVSIIGYQAQGYAVVPMD